MSTKFLSPGWRMPRNANQSKSSNYSLNFDGSDIIDCGTDDISGALSLQGNFTISLWFNTPGFDSSPTKFVISRVNGSNEGWRVQFDGTSVSLRGYDGTNSSKIEITQPSVNVWHHLVFTYDGGTYPTCYLDGSPAGESQGFQAWSTLTMPTSAYNFIIGNSAGSNNYNGKLGQVSIFDYALSASQITTLYGDSTNGPGNPMALPNPPKAYYPLGTSAWDGNFLAENNAIGDYVFDFSNDYIDLGTNPFSFTQNLTVSFWMKSTQTSTSNTLIAKDGGGSKRNWAVMIYQNKVYFWTTPAGSTGTLNDIQSTTTFAAIDGKWHHIVVVNDYTNSTKQIYIDGSLDITNNEGAVISNSDAAVQIGKRASGFAYDGEMSNILLWDKALIATEVSTIYNYGSPIQTLANIPQSSNLKAWYKLDASEIYNSSSTEWSVDNNANPSAYTSSLKFVASELDRIDMPHDAILNPSSNYTFSIWFNPTSSNSNSTLVGSSILSRGINMYYPANNTKVTFYHKTSTANESFDIVFPDSPVDTWNNITVTWSASTGIIRAFINGKYVSQKENISDIVWGGTLKVGQYTSYGWYFDGQLSNLAMWDATLTDGFSGTPTIGDIAGGQVAEVYNNGIPQTTITGSPVGWWKLNNGGKFITDSSGNNFTGTNHSGDFQTGGAIEYAGFVNKLAGDSSGMSQSNLVQSDLQTVAPYSKYAMKLDDATLSDYINVTNNSTLQITGNLTLSSWVRIDGSYISNGHLIAKQDSYVLKSHQSNLSNVPRFQVNDGSFHNLEGPSALSLDTWYHIAGVREGNSLRLYVNGALVASSTPTIGNLSVNTHPVQFNAYTSAYSSDLSLSNNAIWNVALNAAEIKEVYNEGLPSNLNTFSGTAPISWWQLGENSSFDGSNWKYADEMTAGNNANSVNTAETALTNGVGTTANGTSSGMAVGALVGKAPYSDANAISSGMSVVSRVTGSGNTP